MELHRASFDQKVLKMELRQSISANLAAAPI